MKIEPKTFYATDDKGGGSGAGGENKPAADDKEKGESEKLHGAITGRLDRFRGESEKALDVKLAPIMSALDELRKQLGGAPRSDDKGKESDEKGKEKGKEKRSVEDAIREAVAPLEAKLREADDEKKKLEAGARAKKVRDSISSALEGAGCTDPVLRDAALLVHVSSGKIVEKEDGSIVVEVQKNGYVDPVPLVDFVKTWASTDTGKRFIPARGAQGSGAGKGNLRGETLPKPKTPEERRALGRSALAKAIGMGGSSSDE